MKIIKKLMSAAVCTVLLTGTVVPVYAEQSEDDAFEIFMNEEFAEAMGADYMSMHFTIRDYAAYGIEKPEAVIGTASWDDYADGVAEAEEALADLAGFDYSKLNEAHQHDYDIYKFYLERMKELNSFPDYDWWYMPSEGLIDNLPTNFTEYVFYEQQDIDDYLDILASVSDYIDDTLDITGIQVSHGIFMTDAALDETLSAIDKFVERTDDNPLIVIFEENVDAFEGLSDEQRQAYKDRNREILFNSYVPAYKRAAQRLESWRGTRADDVTIADLPGGREYYDARIRYKASTDASAQEVLDRCSQYLEKGISEYVKLLRSIKSEKVLDEVFDIENPEDIIAFHEEKMDVYPAGPKVSYRAAYLDPAVASDGVIAYYLEPPIDDIKDNVIKINGDNVSDVNGLYSTLAHEGFPGHLYQITWFLDTKPNPLRSALSNIGYTEGWAMYAEDEAWTYSGLNRYASEFNRLGDSVGYVMNAAADIGVNALGWTVDDLGAYLDNLGLNSEIAPDLFDFVMDTPGVIIPYGAGLAQFMNIHDDAAAKLGDKFDLTAFNEVLLTYGDRPFDLVEKDVEQWISTFDGTEPSPTAAPVDPVIDPERPAASPLIYIGGFAASAVLIIAGILMIRKSRKGNPFS